MKLKELNLSRRFMNRLSDVGIKTIEDLLAVESIPKLLSIKGIGRNSAWDIVMAMMAHDIRFDYMKSTEDIAPRASQKIKEITILSTDEFEIRWKIELDKMVYFFVDKITEVIHAAQGVQSSSRPMTISNITYDCDLGLSKKEEKRVHNAIVKYLGKFGWSVKFSYKKLGGTSKRVAEKRITPRKEYEIEIIANDP